MSTVQTPKIKTQTTNVRHSFDLEERLSVFGENVILLCKKLKVNHISKPLITQLVRSSTSVGANYCEANNASSRKDFRNKVYIAKKEAQETSHWLRMLSSCYPHNDKELSELAQESHELTLILQSISNKLEGDK